MTEMSSFFRATAFEPEMVKRLCDAFDCVMQSLHESGQAFTIEPEAVATQIISFAKQGVSDPMSLCMRTLRALKGKSAVNGHPRTDDTEFLSYVRFSVKQTGQQIANSLALIDEGHALIARIERQLNHSRHDAA
jgi:hypothetical protein